MITKFAGCTVWSHDVNNLVPFYRDTLGLKVADQSDGFVVFGSLEEPTLALGTHSEVNGTTREPYRHMVGFNSDDLDADYNRLRSAGVEFIEPPTLWEIMRIATLKDPEGNLIQLFQPV